MRFAMLASGLACVLVVSPVRAQVEPNLNPPSLTQDPTPLRPAPRSPQPLETHLKSLYGSVQLPATTARPQLVWVPATAAAAGTAARPGQQIVPLARIVPGQQSPLPAAPRMLLPPAGGAPLRVANVPVDPPVGYPRPMLRGNVPVNQQPPAKPLPPPAPTTTTWGTGTSASPPVNASQELGGGAGIFAEQPSMLTPIPAGTPVGSGLTTHGSPAENANEGKANAGDGIGDELLIDPNINPPWTKRLFPNWDPIWHDSVVWQRFDRGRQRVSAALFNTQTRTRAQQELKHGECQCRACRRARRQAKRDFGGWASWGSTFNSHGNTTSTGNDPLPFNNFADGLLLNQAWLFAERRPDPGYRRFDWGYRIDFMFGADGPDTEAFGDGTWDADWDTGGEYGFALPQLYATIGRGNFLVHMGRFYTIIGYETVPAPQNFFYSHSYAFGYNQPRTHTGVLAQYEWLDSVTLLAGYSTGWDTGFRNPNEGGVFLGGVAVEVSPILNIVYALTAGDPGVDPLNESEVYMHSLFGNVAVRPNVNYVLEWNFQNREPIVDGPDERSYGLSQYLTYSFTENFALGARFEWFRDSDGARIGNGPGDYYDLTLGINWRTKWNGVVRPELRYDYFRGAGLPFDDNTEDDQLTAAIAGYWTF